MKAFFRRHRVACIVIVACLLAGLAANLALYADGSARQAQAKQAADAQMARLDEQLAAAKDRSASDAEAKKKAADEKAKKAAEAKNQAKEARPALPSAQTGSAGTHTDPTRPDVIVNKKHPIQPKTFTPSVVTASCAGTGSATIQSQAVSDFQALCAAAKAAGVPLASSSSYRSYAEQVSTYNYWVSVSGQAGADTYSARPGYSEHQTGFAVDFSVPGGATLSDFTGTAQQKWLAKNAYKYGWIQHYTTANQAETGYEAESWHYRYVGRSAAASYTSSGASSLESYWGVSGGDYK